MSLGVSIPLDRAVHLYKDCRFVIACENSEAAGYVSEKVFLAVLAGAIPIVWGSYTLRTMLRPGSYVDLFGCQPDDAEGAAEVAFKQMNTFLAVPALAQLQQSSLVNDTLDWFTAPPLVSARTALREWLRTRPSLS